MSKRKQETGFGAEIDDMLDGSDEEGVLMTGGAATTVAAQKLT